MFLNIDLKSTLNAASFINTVYFIVFTVLVSVFIYSFMNNIAGKG